MASQKGILSLLVPPALTTSVFGSLPTKEPYLRMIEVHFTDSSNATTKIKIPIDDLSQVNKVEFQETTSATSSAVTTTLLLTATDTNPQPEKWKSITEEKEATKKSKYLKLHEIAKQYLEVQHYLNLIRSFSWSQAKQKGKTDYLKIKDICKNGKCCCQTAGSTCTNGTCATCLCCYADNKGANSNDCCCKDGNGCKFDEFKKIQNGFSYYFKNISSSQVNRYLSPVQIHIKLDDTNFSDLETNADSNNASVEYKSFTASTAYGFIDYQYKPQDYSSDIKGGYQDSDNELIEPDNNGKTFFANIPHKFKFTTKKKNGTSSGSDSALPNDHIKKVWDEIKGKKKVTEKVAWLTNNSAIDKCCCCDNTNNPQENFLNCTIKRNLVFMVGKDKLSDISKKLENSKTCCATPP
ncbi:hypothetical protein MHSWG343_03670 [Candidatus Mycoplasma haematohominis]|uniref:Uncharacterized protein n=1 Tax=Candidatus Mycoplasma haematohominis TaxID=1494318 RepID=A0A478FPN3_9MOLU|nr:hypothetical protein MHSWG343_03670 [Candidatus Mycoplasma haemohominis]